jgi:hypothetical protein
MVDTHEYFILPEGAIFLPTYNTGQKRKQVFYDPLISNSFQPTHEGKDMKLFCASCRGQSPEGSRAVVTIIHGKCKWT